MNSKSRLSLAGILVGLAFALSNFGCGGGQKIAATPPLHPAITVTLVASSFTTGFYPDASVQLEAIVANDPGNGGVEWAFSCLSGSRTAELGDYARYVGITVSNVSRLLRAAKEGIYVP